MGLPDADCGLCVSPYVQTNFGEGRWDKKETIPWTADGMKLHIVLKSTEEEAKLQLLNGPATQQERQREVAKTLVLTYRNRSTKELSHYVTPCLSKLKQDLSHTFNIKEKR